MESLIFENIDFTENPKDLSDIDMSDSELVFIGCKGFERFKFPKSSKSIYFDKCLDVKNISDFVKVDKIYFYGFHNFEIVDFECFKNFKTESGKTLIFIDRSTIKNTSIFSKCDGYFIYADITCNIQDDVIDNLLKMKNINFNFIHT